MRLESHPEHDNITEADRAFMREAIRQMRQAGVVDRTGGPFGAIIVRNGTILSAAGNSVLRDNDPTAHAEINAIRLACKRLQTFNLSGCILYTSCECCPMCYAAAYWARVSKIFYAASWTDYEDVFDDSKINIDVGLPYPKRLLAPVQILREEAHVVWNEFRNLANGARY